MQFPLLEQSLGQILSEQSSPVKPMGQIHLGSSFVLSQIPLPEHLLEHDFRLQSVPSHPGSQTQFELSSQ
jgi:hypothetical protein